ncbi:hypothetical protein GUJ93_ZPchr0008g12214 [Zizania palustris]|uniref:Protein kinase domain-containing protein n=1 Tax=Zizania palustris TaxID=103762 RepID=A0A8J5RAI2_ZIZPA|nr:hypothetical protein GUJ93_ZPchr0008g12214 [Zizania palustris]
MKFKGDEVGTRVEWSVSNFGSASTSARARSTSPARSSGCVVALKLIFETKLEKYWFHTHLRWEIEIQHGLDHPNALRLFAWSHDGDRAVPVLEFAARGSGVSVVVLILGLFFLRCWIIKVYLLFPRTPYVSADAKDLISKLLVKDSSKRLSLDDIMKHPWILKSADPSGAVVVPSKEVVI